MAATSDERPELTGGRDAPDAAETEIRTALGRYGDDLELFADLAAIFPDDARRLLENAEKGVATGDAAKVRAAAHDLKSLSATVGGSAASRTAAGLEQMGRAGTLEGSREALERLKVEVAALSAALFSTVERMRHEGPPR